MHLYLYTAYNVRLWYYHPCLINTFEDICVEYICVVFSNIF